MLQRKLLVVNRGHGERGKSASLNRLIDYLHIEKSADFEVVELNLKTADHWAILKYQDVLIGIESQGDPRSRMPKTMDYFMQGEHPCDIIITASRTKRAKVTKGKELIEDPFRKVLDMQRNYTLVWNPNPRTQVKEDPITQEKLRELWVKQVDELIREWVGQYKV